MELQNEMERKTDGMEKKKGDRRQLLALFLGTLYISAFTFGGGFVIVTFMKKKFVDELHWIDEKEMLDFTALAQASPGAIAVNAAILVGWKIGGFFGMLTAVAGTILPPMVILSVISVFYAAFASNPWIAVTLEGMQAGVAAVILSVSCDLWANVRKEKSLLYYGIFAAAFIGNFVFGVSVIFLILAAAAVGLLRLFFDRRKEAGS